MCAHQVLKNGPFSSRMLKLFRPWPFFHLSHRFPDGIPSSTWSNAGSSLCSPRWSTLVSGAAISFPSVNFICRWDTWILPRPQLSNQGGNHSSSEGSSTSQVISPATPTNCMSGLQCSLFLKRQQVTIIGMYNYGLSAIPGGCLGIW